jgi:hypothetical protein
MLSETTSPFFFSISFVSLAFCLASFASFLILASASSTLSANCFALSAKLPPNAEDVVKRVMQAKKAALKKAFF